MVIVLAVLARTVLVMVSGGFLVLHFSSIHVRVSVMLCNHLSAIIPRSHLTRYKAVGQYGQILKLICSPA